MRDYEQETNQFLNNAYDKVLDKLVESWDFSDWDTLEGELSEVLKEEGCELYHLSAEEENEINRSALSQITEVYVVGMLRTMISYSDKEFSEKELNQLWNDNYGTEEFVQRCGLTKEEGDLALKITERVILEDLFDEPVTVSYNNKVYTISRTEKCFSVKLY